MLQDFPSDPYQPDPSTSQASSVDASASLNLLADSIFAQGLGTDPTGLVTPDDDYDPVEDLLPLRQRMSPVMVAAHESVDQQAGQLLTRFSVAELQALRTQITLREKQLLTTKPREELFEPIDPETCRVRPMTSRSIDKPTPQSRLTLLEYAQIREEHVNLDEVVSTRTTADLVQTLRSEKQFEIPGTRRGMTPLASAISYAAAALKVTGATVDRRVSAATAMWPSMNYRRTKLQTPRLAEHLERGQIPFSTAATAQRRLSDMRQAVRRAGGDDQMADELVKHKEKEFLRHGIRNNPHTFSRFAKQRSDAVTNELIGPRQTLTEEQVKHEKGIFYTKPIGDRLHELTVVVDDSELLQLKAIREFSTKLDSATATLRSQAHQSPSHDEHQAGSVPLMESQHTADDVPNNPRISPNDFDLGIAKLFDGQTKAERWLNTLMDFTSSALLLHKTYDPHATPEEQRRRNTALHKAAEYSEVIADILTLQPLEDASDSTDAPGQVGNVKDPLESLVPPGYQLLRPNLDLIVEIPLRNLTGVSSNRFPDSPQEKDTNSKLAQVVEDLKDDAPSITMPRGSPGDVKIDLGLARQYACAQRVIPMVLGSTSQPLDVGRAQRSFPSAIRRALHVRDRGCVVPGCRKPAEWCQPHHVVEWAEGGPTSLANAALLCRHHHSAVHKQLLVIHMEDDGLPSCSLPKNLDASQIRYRNIYWRC